MSHNRGIRIMKRITFAYYAIVAAAAAACCGCSTGQKAPPRTESGKIVGYMLDVSRYRVPTMETVKRQVDILAELGYNHFQLYTEHTFAYPGHEDVWREASPFTPAEIRELDAYCAERGIELVPNQNSFGHLEHWLSHPAYNHLAEAPQGGTRHGSWVCARPAGEEQEIWLHLDPDYPFQVEGPDGLVAGWEALDGLCMAD